MSKRLHLSTNPEILVKIALLVSQLRWLESRPLKKIKNKEKTSVKYIALPASLPSGLNKTVLTSGKRANNACSINLPSLRNIIWLPWQRPSANRKIRSTFIICTQSTLIGCKACENRSSRCRDIWRNTPVFWLCCTRRLQMSSVNSGVTWPNFRKFSHGIQASFALSVNAHSQTMILHFVF